MTAFAVVDGPLSAGGSLAEARRQVAAVWTGAGQDVKSIATERDRVLDFVSRHDDALSRSCLEGHLTGSALIVDDDRERMLILLHAKLGRWLQPGGHADGEGNLALVALTEANEETGIEGLQVVTPAVDCDVHEIPGRDVEPTHLHLDLRFVVLAPPDPVLSPNHESRAMAWLTLAELTERCGDDENLVRLARNGLTVARRLPA